jgi:hypothetical protein
MDKDEVQSWLAEMNMWQYLRRLTNRYSLPKRFLLAKLLGKTSYDNMLETFTEEDKQTCEALLGPNGYTVYRTLLIKRGLRDDDYVPEAWYLDRQTNLDRFFEVDKAPL